MTNERNEVRQMIESASPSLPGEFINQFHVLYIYELDFRYLSEQEEPIRLLPQ